MAKKAKASTGGDLNFVRYEKLVKALYKKVGPRVVELIHQDMVFLEALAKVR